MRKFYIYSALLFLFTTPSFAGSYIHPQVGATIPLDGGDTSYALGGTFGYQWNKFLATEASYLRIIGSGNAGDGDLFKGEGILSYPMEWVTPYVSGGVGELHASLPGKDAWNPMILVGAGANFNAFDFIGIGIGVSYASVKNQGDFIQPVLSIGLNL